MPRTRRVTTEQWAGRVTAWQRSGRSATVFATEHGWDPAQLRWWRWKLERTGAIPPRDQRAAADSTRDAAAARPTFLRLVASDEHCAPVLATPTRFELVLPDGLVLRFDDAVAPATLRALVDALEVRA